MWRGRAARRAGPAGLLSARRGRGRARRAGAAPARGVIGREGLERTQPRPRPPSCGAGPRVRRGPRRGGRRRAALGAQADTVLPRGLLPTAENANRTPGAGRVRLGLAVSGRHVITASKGYVAGRQARQEEEGRRPAPRARARCAAARGGRGGAKRAGPPITAPSCGAAARRAPTPRRAGSTSAPSRRASPSRRPRAARPAAARRCRRG
jgi:hypothetical protein